MNGDHKILLGATGNGGMATPPNLLFVTVDCLRQDFVAGEHADIPFISEFRSSGLEYSTLFSTTTTTTPSVTSLLTGSYSERNGVNSLRDVELNDSVATMAELFGDSGYETRALVTGPLVEDIGIDRGFDRFTHRETDQNLVGPWYDDAVSCLDSLSEPFFLYVHLWELHEPISVPAAFDDPSYGQTPYARMLSALDRRLGEFVSAAPDDTVTVLHGDHGESISWRHSGIQTICKRLRDRIRYEQGLDTRRLERFANRLAHRIGPEYKDHFIEDGHGETILDCMTNVPFVMNGPSVEASTVDALTRQVDILPTLVEQFDLAEIPNDIDGESLLPPESITDRQAYIRACGASLRGEANWQRGLRTPAYKYVEYPNRDWGPELYDLDADEHELTNVADARPDVVADLRAQLPTEELKEVDQVDIDDHLRDLGYL